MLKPSTYIILAAFSISLEIYRIQTPLGLNIASYHIFFALALYTGGLAFLSRNLKTDVDRDTRVFLMIFILFAGYSFLSFIRNIGSMRPESMSLYLSELVGYALVLSVPIFVSKTSELQKVTKAFLASSIFVYMGTFWHIYNFTVLGQFVTGTPFWQEYTKSQQVSEYLGNVAWFVGFPRFRLPFSSSAGTGLFLSLAGILLLSLTLHHFANKKRGAWMLILASLFNLFCLLGTFARASWAVFLVGFVIVVWHFRKFKIVSFGKITSILLVFGVLFFAIVSLIPIGNEFFHMIGLRFDPEVMKASDIVHLESRLLALHYWAESPIGGLGIGGFFTKPGGGIHTHSTYFTILVDRGLIGLLLFLGFLLQFFRILKKKIQLSRNSNDRRMLSYNIGFLGILGGLLVSMFLYELLSEVVWMIFGIILANIKLLTDKRCHERTRTL